MFKWISVALLAVGHCLASPTPNTWSAPVRSGPLPLVLWHGLGDTHSSEGMVKFQELIKDIHQGIFIHSIYIQEDQGEDQKAGFFGNVLEQLGDVAEQLKSIPELQGGFDALGFSQGGQFLRAYTEMYNDPPVHNLITFGSQHFGISEIPECSPWNIFCKAARSAARAGVYTSWAQNSIVQAQYFRDVDRFESYLEHNVFLTGINNEHPENRNQTYAKNLASLSNFVMAIFDEDTTVVPKESAQFGSYELPKGDAASARDDERAIINMRDHPIYKEDWIGLKKLDQKGAIHFWTCHGVHMHLDLDCWKPVVEKYVGGTSWNSDPVSLPSFVAQA